MVKGIPESWLVALPESLLAQIVSFVKIEQGRANSCFFSLADGQDLFAKQTDSLSLQNEVRALHFLAANAPFSDLTYPELFSSNEQLLITKKVNGLSLSAESFNQHKQVELTKALVELHKLDFSKIASDFTHFDLPSKDSFVESLKLVACSALEQSRLSQQLTDAIAVLSKVPSLLGFIHGDLTKDNIILSAEGKLVLLDWELADIRDVRWDLATICEEYSLSQNEIKQLSIGYTTMRDIDDPDFQLGLSAWRFIYLVVCFTWALSAHFEHQSYLDKLLSFKQ